MKYRFFIDSYRVSDLRKRLQTLQKSHCLYAGIEQEGKIEGRAEGRDEERFSIARNMKQLGIPVDVIVKSTGMTSGEIETL